MKTKKQGWQGTVCLRIEELGICQGAAGCSSLGVLCLQGKYQAVAIPFTGFTGFTTPPSPSRWLSAASIQPSAEAITSKSVYVDSCFGRLQIRNLPLQFSSILMGKHGKYIRWFQPSNLGQAPLSDKPTLHDDILEMKQTHEVVECQNQDFTNRNQWPGTQFCSYLPFMTEDSQAPPPWSPPLWPVVVVWFFWSPPRGLWWWYVGMLVCMYVSMYVCMYVGMLVCMYVGR